MATVSGERTLVQKAASALFDARKLYEDLLADLAEFEAAESADDDAFLAEVRATGHDVGLFLLFFARVIEESDQDEMKDAAAMLRQARPLIDSLALLVSARTREDLLGLPLASAETVARIFAEPKLDAWIALNLPVS